MAQDFLIQPLELRFNNPYSTGVILVLPDGSLLLERQPVVYVKSNKDRYYTVIQGDTLWAIAHEAYGDSKLWWIIADVNKLEFPFELEQGKSLLVPDFNVIKLNN